MDKERFLQSGLLEQYVLGLTSAEENREVEHYLSTYPEVGKELEDMRKALDLYARRHAIPPAKRYRENLFDEIDSLQNEIITPEDEISSSRPKRSFPWFWMFLCVVLGFFGYAQYMRSWSTHNDLERMEAELSRTRIKLSKSQEEVRSQASLLGIIQHPASRRFVIDTVPRDDGRVCLIFYKNDSLHNACVGPVNLPALPAEHQYQVWTEADGQWISLGTLDDEPGGMLPVAFTGSIRNIYLSIEPHGGSKLPDRDRIILSKQFDLVSSP